jgi:dihydrofolate reductase
MSDQMSAAHIPLALIVAATIKNGIGKNGALPWPMLKKEMAYFARVTKRVPMPNNTGSVQSDALETAILDGTRRNVVIMGRKTWDSIPPKFRPLKDRTNIVISTQDRKQLNGVTDDVLVASNITSGLQTLDEAVKAGQALPVGRAFVIGGSSIYATALELEQAKHVLLTRIDKEHDCDTFFPELNEREGWQRGSRGDLEAFVGEDVSEGGMSEVHGDQEVRYEFQLFERP